MANASAALLPDLDLCTGPCIMRGGRGMRSGLQESLRAGETDNMNNPLFLHPLGARSIKTPRMQARESKSQRGSTRTSQWNSSSQSSGPNVGVPRLSLDRVHAHRKVLFFVPARDRTFPPLQGKVMS